MSMPGGAANVGQFPTWGTQQKFNADIQTQSLAATVVGADPLLDADVKHVEIVLEPFTQNPMKCLRQVLALALTPPNGKDTNLYSLVHAKVTGAGQTMTGVMTMVWAALNGFTNVGQGKAQNVFGTGSCPVYLTNGNVIMKVDKSWSSTGKPQELKVQLAAIPGLIMGPAADGTVNKQSSTWNAAGKAAATFCVGMFTDSVKLAMVMDLLCPDGKLAYWLEHYAFLSEVGEKGPLSKSGSGPAYRNRCRSDAMKIISDGEFSSMRKWLKQGLYYWIKDKGMFTDKKIVMTGVVGLKKILGMPPDELTLAQTISCAAIGSLMGVLTTLKDPPEMKTSKIYSAFENDQMAVALMQGAALLREQETALLKKAATA